MHNIILCSDSYKTVHHSCYPPNMTKMYSYFEARKGAKFPETLFFGLQYFLKQYLRGTQVTKDKIDYAEELIKKHIPNQNVFNREGWEYILKKHCGFLPIKIKALPEGSLIPIDNVLMTVENTDDKCAWLVNYLETLLVQTWYPCTVATQSYYMKQNILQFLSRTGDPSLIDFKLCDFGFRGVSCPEQAGIGGLAHLINFKGTDTMAALEFGRQYYSEECAGFSIPATEHSTITSWGKENEAKAYKNLLDQYPNGLIACVSDSYSLENACTNIWGGKLKNKVWNREGTLVVRPDSGDPIQNVLMILNILGKKFSYSYNQKGYKVLHPSIRVIQGDGIDIDSIRQILLAITREGWSADNIAFGSGGGLLQKLNRDTQRFAFKCSSVTVNGQQRDVFKQPATDLTKSSKAGLLKLIQTDRGYQTVLQSEPGQDILETVYEDGKLCKEYTLEEIRKRANNG